MASEPTIADLLDRAGRNDRQAWQTIVLRYQNLVWSVIRNHRLDSASAEDAFQNVWRKLVEKCGTIRDPNALPGWLATTARNEAIEVLRGQRRLVPSETTDSVADLTSPSLDEVLLDDELQRAVLRAFNRLGQEEQRLLRLLCVEELDYQTVSTLLDRPIGSIGPTRQRVLATLKALLRDEMKRGAV